MRDLDQLARLAVFDYLVGNCDNHLKSLSVLHGGKTLRLTPAYDIVCTTCFERFSREMGKRLGSTRAIDDVAASDFAILAHDLGLGVRRLRRISGELVDRIGAAVLDAAEEGAGVIETLPYTAEDLFEEMRPRLAIARSFA